MAYIDLIWVGGTGNMSLTSMRTWSSSFKSQGPCHVWLITFVAYCIPIMSWGKNNAWPEMWNRHVMPNDTTLLSWWRWPGGVRSSCLLASSPEETDWHPRTASISLVFQNLVTSQIFLQLSCNYAWVHARWCMFIQYFELNSGGKYTIMYTYFCCLPHLAATAKICFFVYELSCSI